MSLEVSVAGLPANATNDSVMDFFSRAGQVAEVMMSGDGSASVFFENAEDLEAALQFEDYEDGTKITVRRVAAEPAPAAAVVETPSHAGAVSASTGKNAQERNATEIGSKEPVVDATGELRQGRDAFKVAVRNLNSAITASKLRERFSECGEVVDAFVEPRSRFGFVGFANIEGYNAAIQLHEVELEGTKMIVEGKKSGNGRPNPSAANGDDRKNNRVVLKSLSAGTTEAQLREVLEGCGKIVDLFNNADRGFCFAEFETTSGADAAIAKSDVEVNGSVIQIERREAQRCFKCNRDGHIAAQCRSSAPLCRVCGRPGHIARDCRGGGRGGGFNGGDLNRRGRDDRRGGRRDDRRDDRRRRRSDSYDEDRDRRRRRRSSTPPRRHRRYSRSRSPVRDRRRRGSRSRSPVRDRR